jgi:hypothetical protein
MFARDEFGMSDPVRRAYARYFRRLIIWGGLLLVAVGLMAVLGVPHLQSSYSYTGRRPADGVVRSWQKRDAWYLGPVGWRQVRSGQYGHDGCPFILFIPVHDCLQK